MRQLNCVTSRRVASCRVVSCRVVRCPMNYEIKRQRTEIGVGKCDVFEWAAIKRTSILIVLLDILWKKCSIAFSVKDLIHDDAAVDVAVCGVRCAVYARSTRA